MSDTDRNRMSGDFEAAISMAMQLGEPRSPNKTGQFLLAPEGSKLLSLEEFQPIPSALRCNFETSFVSGLFDYVAKFMPINTPDAMSFINAENKQIMVHLDYHKAPKKGDDKNEGMIAQPSWCTHNAVYRAKYDPKYSLWEAAAYGHYLPQADFAEFLEDHLEDIVEPEAADVLEVAQNFKMSQKVEFSSSVNISNGMIQHSYSETGDSGSMANGKIVCPEKITIEVPIYKGQPVRKFQIRLKHRLNDGKLNFAMKIINKEELEEDEFLRIADHFVMNTKPLGLQSIKR